MGPSESPLGRANGGDEPSPVTADAPREKEDGSVTSRRAGKAAAQESPSRARTRAQTAHRSPPVNAIQATRRHRRERREPGPPAPGAEAGAPAMPSRGLYGIHGR